MMGVGFEGIVWKRTALVVEYDKTLISLSLAQYIIAMIVLIERCFEENTVLARAKYDVL